MIYKPKHFNLEELVCPHVYYQFGNMAWQFIDYTITTSMDWVRDTYGVVFINNWLHEYENSDFVRYIRESIRDKKPIFPFQTPKAPETLFSQRGLRCNICALDYQKTQAGIVYLSGHFLGKAEDYTVQGMTSEEVRKDLIKKKDKLPFPIRLEKNVSWVHMDTEDSGEKITLF